MGRAARILALLDEGAATERVTQTALRRLRSRGLLATAAAVQRLMSGHVLREGATSESIAAAHLGLVALASALLSGSLEQSAVEALARSVKGLKP
jgi:hypothetical protein